MDEHEAWQAERDAVIRRQRIDREEAIERREQESKQAERQASAEATMHARRLTGEPVPTHGDILARARDMLEATEAGRDKSAEYGSAGRPAMYVTAADGSPVEVTARPPAGVRRSVSEAQDDHLLKRARALSADSFMAVEVARFDASRRSAASRAREAAEVARASGYDYEYNRWFGPEITRTCAYGEDGVLRSYSEISR
jgi:hypothetical protein